MRDRILGALILTLALVGMVGYFWILFLAPADLEFLGITPSEWAIIIPVIIIVYAVLLVIAWIGWALASTSPPLPIGPEQLDE